MNQVIENNEPVSPELSVVVPFYDEENNVFPLVDRLIPVLDNLSISYEVVFVNDGSRDHTWTKIREAAEYHPTIRGISLSRNFGHQNALLAGMTHACGRVIVSMDGDLQHPPELISELFSAWRSGFKVVDTRRIDSERTPFAKRLSSRWFYRVFSWLAGFELPEGSSDFRLVDREVLNALLDFRDAQVFLRGMVKWTGFNHATLPYHAESRHTGRTKYSLRKMLRFAGSAVISFSDVPLRLGIYAGLLTSIFAVVEMAYTLWAFFAGHTVPGWTSTLIVMSFMFALLFILLGVMGVYLASLHDAIKRRPRFIIDDTV